MQRTITPGAAYRYCGNSGVSPECLGTNNFRFLPKDDKQAITDYGDGTVLVAWSYSYTYPDIPAFTISFLEKRPKQSEYKVIKKRWNAVSLVRKNLKKGRYNFLIRATFETGSTQELYINARIK
jgi:hypothetical protein